MATNIWLSVRAYQSSYLLSISGYLHSIVLLLAWNLSVTVCAYGFIGRVLQLILINSTPPRPMDRFFWRCIDRIYLSLEAAISAEISQFNQYSMCTASPRLKLKFNLGKLYRIYSSKFPIRDNNLRTAWYRNVGYSIKGALQGVMPSSQVLLLGLEILRGLPPVLELIQFLSLESYSHRRAKRALKRLVG